MRDKLTQYIALLFAGSSDAEDIQQEILLNTLDRYDDLIAQGQSPETAYRMAISGIGDINELLGGQPTSYAADYDIQPNYAPDPNYESTRQLVNRVMYALAICLYIISPAPLFLLEPLNLDSVGLALMLLIIAVATAMLLIFRKPKAEPETEAPYTPEPPEPSAADAPESKAAQKQKNFKSSLNSMISTIGIVLYFLISFKTHAWYITWLIFPIIAAVKGVVNTALEMMERD